MNYARLEALMDLPLGDLRSGRSYCLRADTSCLGLMSMYSTRPRSTLMKSPPARAGALIVIERTEGLRNYVENGILLDSAISVDLLISLFTPETPTHGGAPILRPLLGGSSMAAQDSAILTFGLGDARSGRVEVLWPGGHRNRYFLFDGRSATLPEIPCDFEDPEGDFGSYFFCVRRSLAEMTGDGVIAPSQKGWLAWQAILAWWSAR